MTGPERRVTIHSCEFGWCTSVGAESCDYHRNKADALQVVRLLEALLGQSLDVEVEDPCLRKECPLHPFAYTTAR